MGNRLGLWLVCGFTGFVLGCSGGDSGDSPAVPPSGGSGGSAGSSGGSSGSGGTAGNSGEAGSAGTGGSAGSEQGGTAGSGGGGTGGTGGSSGGPGDDTSLFVPDIPNTYDGPIVDPGMEIIAHTLREGLLGPEFLVAVENVGTDYLCAIDVSLTYLDAQGAELGSGGSLLEVPLVRGCNGTCGFTNCLGPGQIGMATDRLGPSNIDDLTTIASVTHAFGAIILTDAAPTNEIAVTGVELVEDQGRFHYVGAVDNNSVEIAENPSISIFAVNGVGRPLVEATAIESIDIPAGGSWPFETSTFEENAAMYVAYPDVSSPL